jgi:hypothetical protein
MIEHTAKSERRAYLHRDGLLREAGLTLQLDTAQRTIADLTAQINAAQLAASVNATQLEKRAVEAEVKVIALQAELEQERSRCRN